MTSSLTHDVDLTVRLIEQDVQRLTVMQTHLNSASVTDGVVMAQVCRDLEQVLDNVRYRSHDSSDHPVCLGMVPESEIPLFQERLYRSYAAASTLPVRDVIMMASRKFHCGLGGGPCRVFSLCPVDTEPASVWVSYDHQPGHKKSQAVTCFRAADGEFLRKGVDTGRISIKPYAKGEVMSTTPLTGGLRTFTKNLACVQYKLDNKFTGKAKVFKVVVTSPKPFNMDLDLQFTINVGPHRSADVDQTDTFFIVVEEPTTGTLTPRKVLMYRRPGGDAVASYTPPCQPFQPSDVCFYKTGNQEFVLIADEAYSAIHVVRLLENRFRFVRYLTYGCPLLKQPTALNVDRQGRLWIACDGGEIITYQPKN